MATTRPQRSTNDQTPAHRTPADRKRALGRSLLRAGALWVALSPAVPLWAEGTPAVMKVTNQFANPVVVKMTPSEGDATQAALGHGKSNAFSFDGGATCADLSVDFTIRLSGGNAWLYASGSFDLVAVPGDSGDCTMEVTKPTISVPDYNHQLVWKKVSASKGTLTFGYRGGE
jgi:hypothetical protein